MAQDNIKNLYEALKDDYDLGTEQDFRQSLGDANNRRNLYSTIKDDYDLGSEQDFNNSLGYGVTGGDRTNTTNKANTTVRPAAQPPMTQAEHDNLSPVAKEVAEGVGLKPEPERDAMGLTEEQRQVIVDNVKGQLDKPLPTYGQNRAEWEREQHEAAVRGAEMKKEAAARQLKNSNEKSSGKAKEPTLEEKAAWGEHIIEDARRNVDSPDYYEIYRKAPNTHTIEINTKDYTDRLVSGLYAEADAVKKRMSEQSPDYSAWGDDNGMRAAQNAMAANKVDDPERIEELALKKLKEDEWYIKNNAAKRAHELQSKTDQYIDVNDFADYAYRRTVADTMAKVRNMAVERERPHNDFEGMMSGVNESIVGNMAGSLTTTPGHVKARQQAADEWRQGAGTWANVGRSTAAFVADTPFFGVSGSLSGAAVERIAKQQLAKYVARGLSEKAAARVIQTKLANSFGRRMADSVMKGVAGGAVNLGTYEGMSEAARQYAVQEFKPEEIMKSVAHGAASGAALGVTGGAWGEATAKLSGAPKILANVAGFGIEAGTFTATGELEKWASGQGDQIHWLRDFGENAAMILAMKASTPKHLLQMFNPKARQEANVPKFSDAERNEILSSRGGRELYDLVSEGKSSKEEYAQAYERFVNDPDVSFTSKQKVSYALTEAMQRKTPEVTTYDIEQTDDGKAILSTRAADGSIVEKMEFSTPEAAELYGERLTAAIMQGETSRYSRDAGMAAAGEIRREMGISDEKMQKILTGEDKSEEADTVRRAFIDRFNLITTEREMNDAGRIEEQKGLPETVAGNLHEDGTVHKATLYPSAENGGTPQEVFVVKGDIVMREDGRVDTEASSDVVYYKDADGNTHMASPDKFQKAEEPVSAEEVMPAEEDRTNTSDKTNTTAAPRFFMDDEVKVTDADGNTYNGVVSGTFQSGDRNEITVDYEDAKGRMRRKTFSYDELARMNGYDVADRTNRTDETNTPMAEDNPARQDIGSTTLPHFTPQEYRDKVNPYATEGISQEVVDGMVEEEFPIAADYFSGNITAKEALLRNRYEEDYVSGLSEEEAKSVADEKFGGYKEYITGRSSTETEVNGEMANGEGEVLPVGGIMSERDAANTVSQMEKHAEAARELELTPENWASEFGEDGTVDTPVGTVKMGENQYLKLLKKKREAYFGMVKPTLENPDMVLEEYDPKEGAERATKYLFIKTFIKPDGSRYVNFESVTVQKDNLEVSVSSHEITKEALIKKVHQDKLIHLNDKFSSSDVRLTEPQNEGSDLVPAPNSVSSAGKDMQNSDAAQGNGENLSPMPMLKDRQDNDTEEPDFSQVEPSRAHAYIYNEGVFDTRTEANAFVKANVDAAQKALDKVKKKEPKMGTSISAYKAAKAALADELAQAKKQVDYWNAVKSEQAKVVAAERAAQAEKEKAIHDAAVEEERQLKINNEKLKAERAAVGNENPMPAITEKWNTAPKVDGVADEMVLPNGERVTGHYVLTESGAATPSHQSTNGFRKSEGFPMDENGNTVNDRDYERDTDAQGVTRNIASQYDSRALQTPVVVSQDGVVLSGNGRTMAGELAAQDNTDAAYNDYLRQYAQKYGFTSEQVAGMQHPRVVFVPDERMPYTAETFAKFNQQEMKSQSKTEQAVKLGKIVDDGTFNRIVRNINAFDTLGEFYNDAKAANEAIKELQAAGVINQQQLAEMYDGDGISAAGCEILENTLIGKAFESNPDAVRMITEFKSMRQSVITALSEIANNIGLGEELSLEKELSAAVELCYNARHDGYRHGERVSGFARQTTLFGEEDETVADYTNATIMRLADLLNDTRVSQLKKTLAIYNAQAHDSAVGQADMFFDGVKGKEDILKEVLQILNNGTDEQQNAAINNAVEQRKRASQVEGDTVSGRGETGGEATHQPRNGRTGLDDPRIETLSNGLSTSLPYSGRPVTAARFFVKDGVGYTLYADEEGNPALVLAVRDDDTYAGYFRLYTREGKPTNRWSRKIQNSTGDKEMWRGLVTQVNGMLPQGHELTEHSSVSTDGLRSMAGQLNHGYALQTRPDGSIVTKSVKISYAGSEPLGIEVPADKQGSFDDVTIGSLEEFETVRKVLTPYMEAFGLTADNIHRNGSHIKADLPVLRKVKDDGAAAPVPASEETLAAYRPRVIRKPGDRPHRKFDLERDSAGTRLHTLKPTLFQSAASVSTDAQGNPIDKDGRQITEEIGSIDELTDEDFTSPKRSVQLPSLPKKVADAIGVGSKPIIIKKNIFEKNKDRHKDLSPAEGRTIISEALYNPDRYGQNQKVTRPYNWILIHLNDEKHSAIIIEVSDSKDNLEVVNWHYLEDDTLKQKERQAIKEGGLILPLSDDSAAGDTVSDSLSSGGKDRKSSVNEQRNEVNSSSDKIDDWGEEIKGARKNAMREVARGIEQIDERELAEKPLSQVWKRPDYAKLVVKGEMTEQDEKKPEDKRKNKLGVGEEEIDEILKEDLEEKQDFITKTDSRKRTAMAEFDREGLDASLTVDGKPSRLHVATHGLELGDTSFQAAEYRYDDEIDPKTNKGWQKWGGLMDEWNKTAKEEEKVWEDGDSAVIYFKTVDAALKFHDWVRQKEKQSTDKNTFDGIQFSKGVSRKPAPLQRKLGEAAAQVLKDTGVDVTFDEEEARKALEKSDTVMLHRAEMEEVSRRFDAQLDAYEKGEMRSSDWFSLGTPSATLLAAGIPAKEMTLNQSTLKKHLQKHSLTTADLKGLVEALQSPMMVYDWGSKAKAHVIITDLTTKDGRKIAVAVRVGEDGTVQEVNEIASVHGKAVERLASEINTDKTDFGKENLRYVDKKKALDWIAMEAPLASSQTNKGLNSAAKIINDFENPSVTPEILQKMTVFHGSPHSFDRFDFSHMGEGEGTQVHGWGSYVAVDQETGRGYAETLTPRKVKYKGYDIEEIREFGIKGKEDDEIFPVVDILSDMENHPDWSFEDARDFFIRQTEISNYYSPRRKAELTEEAKKLREEDFSIQASRSLYSVEIPNNTGSNYIEEDGVIGDETIDSLSELLGKEYGEDTQWKANLKYGQDGRRLYDKLTQALGSDKAASEFLNRAGFVGIHYYGRRDGECYVIFNENDMQIVSHEQFWRTPDGEVYGFVKDGRVYMDQKKLNPNTPVHEYGHLWSNALMKAQPELWAHGKEMMKKLPLWEEVRNEKGYQDIRDNEDLVASEVFSRLLGDEGEMLLDDMVNEAKAKGDPIELAETVTLAHRIKEWLKNVLMKIRSAFGHKWTAEEAKTVTLDELKGMALKDFAEGFNPTKIAKESDLKNTGNVAHESTTIYETRDRKQVRFTSANPAAYGEGLPLREARPDRADDGARPGGVQRQADGLTRLRGNDLRADEGEFCHVERVFRESGAFNFTAGERIENAADVAYIFTELEDAAVENAFVTMVKDGKPTVVHVGVGNFDMTMVNQPVVKLAYDRLRPDKVYFVHNHPSGNVKCSYQDVQVLKNMRSMLGTDVEGVIINLKSGKYGVFDTEMRNDERVKPTIVEGEHPIKLYSFDKQVFAPDYKPDETLNSAEKVAAFVSSHRLGDRKKLSFLVVNNQLGVTANIHTPYINIDDSNRAAFAEDVARAITEFGGTSAFVYGDFAESKGKYGDTILDDLNKEVRRLSGGTYSVRDLVKVEGNNTKSAVYGDVFEPRAEYGGIEAVNDRFNEQLSELTEENANSVRLKLGMPSNRLLAAGVPNKPLVLYGNKLMKKAKTHGFDARDVKDLPQALQEPIAVFEGSHPDSFAVLTEMQIQGRNVLVSIETNKDGEIDFNIVSSVFGKNGKGVTKWIIDGKLRAVDKGKALNYIGPSAPIADATYNQELVSAANVVRNFENPNITAENIASEHGIDYKERSYSMDDMAQPKPEEGESAISYARRLGDWHKRMEKAGMVAHDSGVGYGADDTLDRQWRDMYDEATTSAAFKFREAAQDGMLSVTKLMETIAKETGTPIAEDEDVWALQNRLGSKNKVEQEYYIENYYKPIIAAVQDLVKQGARYDGKGKDIINADNDVSKYIIAKHGLERNDVFAQREFDKYKQEHPQGQKTVDDFRRDFSGLTELFGGKDWDAQARQYVSKFESGFDTTDLWDAINTATKKTLKDTYEAGLISREGYETARDMFQYYVPLRGWANDVASEHYHYKNGSGEGGRIMKHAKGRTSLAEEPIAYIGRMGQDAILQANKNKVKQRLYNLAMNHDTTLLTVRRQWYQNMGTANNPDWQRVYPELRSDMDADEVADALKAFDDKMKSLKEQGMARNSRKGLTLGYHTTKGQEQQHRVNVSIGGREYNIFVNGNPRAAQAINGELRMEDDNTNIVQKVNRWLSGVYTSMNPEFVITNYERDAGFAASIVAATEPLAYQGAWVKNMAIYNPVTTGAYITHLINKVMKGKTDPNNKAEVYMQEFLFNGGETGYVNMLTVDDYKKLIKQEVKKINAPITPKSVVKVGTAFVERANRVFEDATRFATYVTSREQGRSIDRAIRDAKEISLNFNTRGADGMKGDSMWHKFFRNLRRWIIFTNPSIQGLNKAGVAFKNHPVRSTIMIAGVPALLGYGVAALSRALLGGDDDDEAGNAYMDLPKWTRRTNICIPIGGTKFITIPLSYELRVSYGLGEMLWEIEQGLIEPSEMAKETVAQLSDLLPVSFMGDATALQQGSPSVATPVIDVYLNRDFMGKPIYKDNGFNGGMPEYTKAYAGTSKWLKKSAEWLNNHTGGDKYTPGKVNVNPAVVEHLLDSYLGGLFTFPNKTIKAVQWALGDEDMADVRNLPIISRNIRDSKSGNPINKGQGDRYYDYMREYRLSKQRLNGYKREVNHGVTDFLPKLMDFYNSPEGQRMLLIDEYKKSTDKTDKQVKAMGEYESYGETDEQKRLKHISDSLKQELVEKLDSVSEKK